MQGVVELYFTCYSPIDNRFDNFPYNFQEPVFLELLCSNFGRSGGLTVSQTTNCLGNFVNFRYYIVYIKGSYKYAVGRDSGGKSFVYRLIRSFVTFVRSSLYGGGGCVDAVWYQLLTICHASLVLPLLSSSSAAAPAAAHRRFLSPVRATCRRRLRRRYSA